MAKYRQIHITFWQDPFIEELEPMQKYFYLYLMTNSKTSQCGCYEISNKLIRYETGLSQEEIDDYIELFSENRKIVYSKTTNEFLIVNWLKHNSFGSPKVKSCIYKELENIKNKNFVEYIKAILNYEIGIDSLSIDYTKYMDSGSLIDVTPIDTGSQKEKEQEQKKEPDKEKEENKNNNKKDIDSFFEECWKLYPKKEGKGSISNSKKKEIFSLGEEFKRAIERYKNKITTKKIDIKYIKHGSTFFNSGYVDYLDENYQESKENKGQNKDKESEAKYGF